ncbi:MAG: phosphoserine phosphatase SerB [Pseudomonadota bacterium]
MEKILPYLQQKNISVTNANIIEDAASVQIPVSYEGELKALQKELGDILYEDQVDVAVLPMENRRKMLLIADMDSTMIEQECIDELADFADKKEEVSEITSRAMRGEMDFEESLIERVKCLKGIAISDLKRCFNERITFTPGGKEMVRFTRSHGGYTALVSGGFSYFAQHVAKKLDFHVFRANELGAQNSILTGEVHKPILDRASKKAALEDYMSSLRIPRELTLAVGDGANDIDMIQAAGLGVAFHAKPAVADAARVAIHFADLRAIKYLQYEL